MKYLQLYDHLGNLVKEFEVFVDGRDFTWAAPKPEPVWLGTIRFVSVKAAEPVEPTPESEPEEPEPEPKHDLGDPEFVAEAALDRMIDEAEEEQEVSTPAPFTTTKPTIEEVPVKGLEGEGEEVYCTKCGLTGARRDFPFGHDDFCCIECGTETIKPIEGVKREPKKRSHKSRGAKGTSSSTGPKRS